VNSEPSAGGALRAPYRALVVTASNRAAADVYEDKGGPLIAGGLKRFGFDVEGPQVAPTGIPWRPPCAPAWRPDTT